MDNLLLAGLARSSVYKTHGMARVFCGVDQDRVQHQEPNLAEDLRRLDAGVWITIPDEYGGMRRVRLRACVCTACDAQFDILAGAQAAAP